MTRIVASEKQRSCRDLFKEAVAKAKKVMADPVQKAAWKKKVRQKHLVFNMIIKHYMLAEKKAAKKRELEGKYLLRSCFKQAGEDLQHISTEPPRFNANPPEKTAREKQIPAVKTEPRTLSAAHAPPGPYAVALHALLM